MKNGTQTGKCDKLDKLGKIQIKVSIVKNKKEYKLDQFVSEEKKDSEEKAIVEYISKTLIDAIIESIYGREIRQVKVPREEE